MAAHPDDFPAMRLKWRFPFGARFSPGVFHRLTPAVCRMMAARGFSKVVVYLDNFLSIEKFIGALYSSIECVNSVVPFYWI